MIRAQYTDHENKIIKHLANKIFIYHTTVTGIKFIVEHFKKLESVYEIKIRSDMDFVIGRILQQIERINTQKLHSGILIQYLEPFLPYLSSIRIPDFWYGGMFKDFKISNEVLYERAKNGNSFSLISHYDMSLAFLYFQNVFGVSYVRNLEYLKNLKPKSIFIKIFHIFLRMYHTMIFNKPYRSYFHLFDREVEKSIIW